MKNDLEAKVEENARRVTFGKKEALELLRGADQLIAAKGKKIIQIDLKKEKPAQAELLKLMLGPTGNLRAPTIRKGKKLIVGFNEEAYSSHFG
ncbi:MAG: hypothetical protein GY841_11190 [FCB group bacterium]|nr:hypothetical protein [FCB group bacterium]